MSKTCSLSTVKNTPSEARRSVSYFVWPNKCSMRNRLINGPSLQYIIDVIYSTLELCDLTSFNDAVICKIDECYNTHFLYIIKVEKGNLILKRL